MIDGIPVTTVGRTVFDLAAVVDRHELERSIEQAEALLDSWQYHAGKAAFRRDRVRDRRLKLAGWEPVRVTAWDLEDDPDRLEAELLGLLRVAA